MKQSWANALSIGVTSSDPLPWILLMISIARWSNRLDSSNPPKLRCMNPRFYNLSENATPLFPYSQADAGGGTYL
jgi:hypothetical protein